MAEDIEDGEIEDMKGRSDLTYHPSLEWPGNDNTPNTSYSTLPMVGTAGFKDIRYRDVPHAALFDASEDVSSSSVHMPSSTIPSLRLVRLPSSVGKPALPKSQRLAVVDGYAELQFGRDAAPPESDKPRIRLKEMEVSKLHATVYWDPSRLEWAVVDMGSKHGTFLKSIAEPSLTNRSSSGLGNVGMDDTRGFRLSSSRISSVPRTLRHLDQLSLGSTTFVLHIHEGGLPCDLCSSTGSDEIPLFSGTNSASGIGSSAQKRQRDGAGPPAALQSDPRKALTTLKRTLLSRHGTPSRASPDNLPYVDRSARRRALHPDAPIMNPTDSSFNNSFSPGSAPSSIPIVTTVRPPSPPAPLSSSSIGHRLLMKQGWAPGTALRPSEPDETASDAHSSISLVTPIEAKSRTSRRGLGLPDNLSIVSQPNMSWKDEGKYRRWSNVK